MGATVNSFCIYWPALEEGGPQTTGVFFNIVSFALPRIFPEHFRRPVLSPSKRSPSGPAVLARSTPGQQVPEPPCRLRPSSRPSSRPGSASNGTGNPRAKFHSSSWLIYTGLRGPMARTRAPKLGGLDEPPHLKDIMGSVPCNLKPL